MRAASAYHANRTDRHPDCWLCAPSNGHGLAVAFKVDETGSVTGKFPCGAEYTGYPGYLHGGVTSALLDGAMTNCLLANGTPGLTARLEVRFLLPVRIGRTATVRAWLDRTRGPLYMLAAELRQGEQLLATAAGKFFAYPAENTTDEQKGSQ
jgi:acyl-coenzyme A thioesterase PaaI-like protein